MAPPQPAGGGPLLGESNPEITKARDEFQKNPKIARLVSSDRSYADRLRLKPDQKAANNAKDDDLKCVFFRGLQGLYVQDGIEDALRSVAKTTTAETARGAVMRDAVHITRIGLTTQQGDVQRMMLIWDKWIMPRHITFDDGTRMVYHSKRTRADEEFERRNAQKEEGDKDVAVGGVDSDDDDMSTKYNQPTGEARPKGWKEGKYQCFSLPAYSNIGDITGLASTGGIVLPDQLVQTMKTADSRTNQLIYHDVNQDAGHGWVVYVNKKPYHKVSPELMLALELTEGSHTTHNQDKEEVSVDPLNTGNPIETTRGEAKKLIEIANRFKKEGQFKKRGAKDEKGKERAAKLNLKGDTTKMETAKTELVADIDAVGVKKAVKSYTEEMSEIMPQQPQPSTPQSSNVFEQAQAVDQKDEALKDIALDVQMEAKAFAAGRDIEDHEAQPDGSFEKKKEDAPDAEMKAAVENVVQKADHAASVVEEMDITKSSDKAEVSAAIGEAKAAANDEQEVRNKAHEAAISEKDADIAALNKKFAEHTEANVLLQQKLDEMGVAHEAATQENTNYEYMMKKMQTKLGKSEKQIGQMVAKPKEMASDGMGIHKAFGFIGAGLTSASQGDYTSSESTAAILALVFLFGVAMIGMNYAKGGVV